MGVVLRRAIKTGRDKRRRRWKRKLRVSETEKKREEREQSVKEKGRDVVF